MGDRSAGFSISACRRLDAGGPYVSQWPNVDGLHTHRDAYGVIELACGPAEPHGLAGRQPDGSDCIREIECFDSSFHGGSWQIRPASAKAIPERHAGALSGSGMGRQVGDLQGKGWSMWTGPAPGQPVAVAGGAYWVVVNPIYAAGSQRCVIAFSWFVCAPQPPCARSPFHSDLTISAKTTTG